MGKVVAAGAVIAKTGLTTGGEFPSDLEAVDSAILDAQLRHSVGSCTTSAGKVQVCMNTCLHVYAQTCVGDGYGILAWSKVCLHFVDPYVDALILFSGI